jgi:hypothetical protein
MNNMPKKLRRELAEDPEYRICMVTGEAGTRTDPIEWHHAMTWAGSQLQKRFAIVSIKRSIHEQARNSVVKEFIDWIVLNRMTEDEIDYYSKAIDLRYKRDQLNRIYGVWRPKEAPALATHSGINYPWLNE